jgi:hypothetical protein
LESNLEIQKLHLAAEHLRYYATGRIEFRRGGKLTRRGHVFVAESVWKLKFNLDAGYRCKRRQGQEHPTEP